MINFYFSLSWPLKKKSWPEPLVYWDKQISKNKAVSLQLDRWSHSFPIIEFGFHVIPYQSHGGVGADVGLLGLSLRLEWYDVRHWDNKTGKWEDAE